jgi:hypothetical protein
MKKIKRWNLLIVLMIMFSSLKAYANDKDACRRISEAALITKTKTLVIGIEGYLSFNAGKTKQAYDHRCRAVRGLASSAPKVGKFGGYVLKNIVIPGIDEYKNQVEFVVVPYTDAQRKGGKAYHCAKIWKEETAEGSSGRRVFLVGHSYGGYALTRLTENLGDLPVDGVLSLDPRHTVLFQPPMHRKGNVSRWENYFQKFGGLPGYQIKGADVNKRLIGKGHTGLPGHETVVKAFKRMIGNPTGDLVVAGAASDSCSASPKIVGKAGEFDRQGMDGNDNIRSHKGSGISGVTDDGSDSKIPVPTRNPRRAVAGGSNDGNIPIPERNPLKPQVEEPVEKSATNSNKAGQGLTTIGGKAWDAPAWWDNWGGTRDSGRSKMGSVPNRESPATGEVADVSNEESEVPGSTLEGETRLDRDSLSLAGTSPLGEDSSASAGGEDVVSGSISNEVYANSGSSRSIASNRAKSASQNVVVAAILESKEENSQMESTLFSRVNKKIKTYLAK